MGLYIKGMKMPTCGATMVIIFPNGDVRGMVYGSDKWKLLAKAIELPPHGDLIDRDILMDSDGDLWDGMWGWSGAQIANAPTIIPAEEDK